MKKLILLPLFSLALVGCAVENDHTHFHGIGLTYQSDIKHVSGNTYSAEVEAAPAAGRTKGAMGYATTNALNYCQKQGKSLKIVDQEISSNFWVNGVAKLKFECL